MIMICLHFVINQVLTHIMKNRILISLELKGIDILITHSPARNFGDIEDFPHRDFECFNELMMSFRPALMLHGHVHKRYIRNHKEIIYPSGTKLLIWCDNIQEN